VWPRCSAQGTRARTCPEAWGARAVTAEPPSMVTDRSSCAPHTHTRLTTHPRGPGPAPHGHRIRLPGPGPVPGGCIRVPEPGSVLVHVWPGPGPESRAHVQQHELARHERSMGSTTGTGGGHTAGAPAALCRQGAALPPPPVNARRTTDGHGHKRRADGYKRRARAQGCGCSWRVSGWARRVGETGARRA
jgi:hypothetical protein